MIKSITDLHTNVHIQACFIIPVAIFAIITSVFLITLPILQKPAPTLLALAAILLGIPVYILFVMETPWRLRPMIFDKISSKLQSIQDIVINLTTLTCTPKNMVLYVDYSGSCVIYAWL